MTVKITIIGLGQIGTSIGMALKGQENICCVGFDIDPKVARQVEKLKVFDHVDFNIPNAVKDANIVVLAIPTDQIHEMIEFVVEDMVEGTVLMETGLAKQAVVEWISELNPAGVHYIGLTPVINPQYLELSDHGPQAARADLFQNGMIGIVAPHATGGQALNQAEALVHLLGATPFFTDPVEIDGLIAATHILPQILAAVLINTTQDQPGWFDGRKVASSTYTIGSRPLLQASTPESMLAAVRNNQENVRRMLDFAIKGLLAVKEDIGTEDDLPLSLTLKKAFTRREKWLAERFSGRWEGEVQQTPNLPSSRESFGRLFGFGTRSRKTKEE